MLIYMYVLVIIFTYFVIIEITLHQHYTASSQLVTELKAVAMTTGLQHLNLYCNQLGKVIIS